MTLALTMFEDDDDMVPLAARPPDESALVNGDVTASNDVAGSMTM